MNLPLSAMEVTYFARVARAASLASRKEPVAPWEHLLPKARDWAEQQVEDVLDGSFGTEAMTDADAVFSAVVRELYAGRQAFLKQAVLEAVAEKLGAA